MHDPDPNKAPVYDPSQHAAVEGQRIQGQEPDERPSARESMLTVMEGNVMSILSTIPIDLSAERAQLQAAFAALKKKVLASPRA